MSIRQPRPIVLPQPLEERVDKAAERQREGRGPDSRAAGRRQAAEEAEVGYWYHHGDDEWSFIGAELPERPRRRETERTR